MNEDVEWITTTFTYEQNFVYSENTDIVSLMSYDVALMSLT